MPQSLWSAYIKECGLLEIIETEYGWITFHMEAGGCLWINDMYVIPEKRKNGHGRDLLEQAFVWGRERGAHYCSMTIHLASKSATAALAGALACGFSVASAGDKNLILIGRLI